MSISSADARVPAAMKAAVIDHFGEPEVMHLATIPVPELGPDEVLNLLDPRNAGKTRWPQ